MEWTNTDERAGRILEEAKEVFPDLFKKDYILDCREEGDGLLLSKDREKVTIRCGTPQEFCRGVLLLASKKEETYTVREKRSFAEFGAMFDMARNGVMNVAALKRMIRLLAFMGYSYIGLYLEDEIRVEGEPYFGYMRGAYTKKELQEIVSYASLFGMEVRPYLQTLAHLNQITRYADYSGIVDTGDILLAGDERTYELLDRMIGTAAEVFPAKKINIGMDEAHMVGLGKYLDQHGYQNRQEIIREHLEKVLAICRKYGLTAQMWSDMFFRLAFHGEYYAAGKKADLSDVHVPEGVELAYWDYYSLDEKHYEDMLRMHEELGAPIAYAGGAWKWSGWAPRNRFSIAQGRAALAACRNCGISDVVITAWGDDGAEASPFCILPSLFYDAQLAYG